MLRSFTRKFEYLINYQMQGDAYETEKKAPRKVAESASKQKDKITISRSIKKRESNRKSLFRRFADITVVTRAVKQQEQSRKSSEPSLNMSLAQKNAEMRSRLELASKNIEQLSDVCVEINEFTARIKGSKELQRRLFYEQRALISTVRKQLKQMQADYIRLKQRKINQHFHHKREIYEIAAQEMAISREICGLDARIEDRNKVLETICSEVKEQAEKIARKENQINKSQAALRECKQAQVKLKGDFLREQSQLFILKIQLNSNVFLGFNSCAEGLDKKLLLEKDIVSWDRQKQRKISYDDMIRFIVIQLYREWRTILRKISYQSSQYQVLLGEESDPRIVEDLKRLLMGDKMRASSKKIQKALIVCSEAKQPNIQYEISARLQNFDNGLISITSLDFRQTETGRCVDIHFADFRQEEFVQTFAIEEKREVSKAELLRLLRPADQRVFCMVEIPLLMHSQAKSRYEQVYDIVKRRNFRS